MVKIRTCYMSNVFCSFCQQVNVATQVSAVASHNSCCDCADELTSSRWPVRTKAPRQWPAGAPTRYRSDCGGALKPERIIQYCSARGVHLHVPIPLSHGVLHLCMCVKHTNQPGVTQRRPCYANDQRGTPGARCTHPLQSKPVQGVLACQIMSTCVPCNGLLCRG